MSRFSDQLNASIDARIYEGIPVINVANIAEEVYAAASMDHMTIGELKMAYVKARIAVAMYERGFRSVIRGCGFYANPATVEEQEYAEKILENGMLSITQKEQALAMIKHGIKSNQNLEGQFEFDIDGNVVVSKTDEEILEQLSKEA